MRHPSALTVVTAVLLVLLPTLAVLQYRWVGQVSEAERDRMERNLRVAAAQFRRGFDNEIVRAVNGLRTNAATVAEQAWTRYADRLTTWTATAEHPALVANIFLIDGEAGVLRVRRWSPATLRFDVVAWPDALAPWQPHFDAAFAAFQARQPLPRAPLPRDGSVLVASLIPTTRQPGPPDPDTDMFGFTAVQLDMEYIRAQMLPDLSELHFTNADGGDRYRVAVIDASDLDTVVYRSDRQAPIEIERAAEVESLHGAFRDPFAFMRTGGGRGGGRGGGDFRGDADGLPRFNLDAGRWALLLQHESGSLEAAVATVRRRNLGVGFGVLLLLTGSIGLISLSSRRAQQLARQQMEFVAGVSHELRTPVAVIRSAAENLSQGVVGSADRVKRYGEMIEGEARRLGEMVERVLQYAGIASGLGLGAREPLAPADVIESAIAASAPILGPAQIQRTIQPDLPPVLGDLAALRSAVQNLIANAVKYGGADGWVGIRAERAGRGRRAEVRITVEDHGPGIPGEELPHIFEPFYRGGHAIERQIHGNGLGLSLVQQIVTAHGGRVTVASRPGAGSAFTIHLPPAESSAVRERPASRAAEPAGTAVHS